MSGVTWIHLSWRGSSDPAEDCLGLATREDRSPRINIRMTVSVAEGIDTKGSHDDDVLEEEYWEKPLLLSFWKQKKDRNAVMDTMSTAIEASTTSQNSAQTGFTGRPPIESCM